MLSQMLLEKVEVLLDLQRKNNQIKRILPDWKYLLSLMEKLKRPQRIDNNQIDIRIL